MSENESLVVISKVKAYLKTKEMLCSGDLLDAVSDAVRLMLEKACDRTKANGRSTVRPCDL